MATFSCEPSRDWPSNGPATWDATHKSLHLLRVDVKECSYSNYGPDQWQDAISPFSSQSLSQSLSSRESENGYGEDGGDTPSSLRGSVSDLSDDVLSTSAYDTSCESHPGSFMGSGSPLEEVLKLPNIVRTDRRPRKSWQQNGKAGESTYTNQPKLIQLPPSRTPIFQEAGLHDHTCLFKSIKWVLKQILPLVKWACRVNGSNAEARCESADLLKKIQRYFVCPRSLLILHSDSDSDSSHVGQQKANLLAGYCISQEKYSTWLN